jgi:hypothetical protein
MNPNEMTENIDTEALLARMRTMTDGDLSVLHASLQSPDSSMATSPGSPNDVLWSAMEKLGWMLRHEQSIPLPGMASFNLLTYVITPEGRHPITELLSKLLKERS